MEKFQENRQKKRQKKSIINKTQKITSDFDKLLEETKRIKKDK